MSENIAMQGPPSALRSVRIGVFWFAVLLGTTALWTGLISADALPDVSGLIRSTGVVLPADERGGAPEDGPGDNPFALSIVGPQRRTVGSRAEYVLTVVNESGSDLPAASVTLSHDSSLRVREASTGAQQSAGTLRWDLGTLRQHERVQIQVELECTSPVPSARLTATLTGATGSARANAARSLRGQAPTGPVAPVNSQSAGERPVRAVQTHLAVSARPDLELRISDTADPLDAGERSTFVLDVENHAPGPTGEIVIHLFPSPNIEITGARLRQGDRRRDFGAFVAGGGFSFPASPSLPAGGRLDCEVEFRARAPGVGELRVLLVSGPTRLPLEVSEPIVINPALTGR